MEKILSRFESTILDFGYVNKYELLGGMVLINFIFTLFMSLIITIINGEDTFEIDFLFGQSLIDIFFVTVILAPIFETFIFQFLILEAILFFLRKVKTSATTFISIVVSGTAFGVSHSYNLFYVLVTILIGFLFAIFYLVAKNHKCMNAFWTVCFVHSSSNLFGFIVDDLFELM